MIIFSCLKKEFDEYVEKGIISNQVYDSYKKKMGKKTKLNQIKSWANSLPFMKEILKDLPENVGIAIEFNIPLTSKRIDFVVSGYDYQHKPVLLLFELKQWEYIWEAKGEDTVVRTLNQIKKKILCIPLIKFLVMLNYSSIIIIILKVIRFKLFLWCIYIIIL